MEALRSSTAVEMLGRFYGFGRLNQKKVQQAERQQKTTATTTSKKNRDTRSIFLHTILKDLARPTSLLRMVNSETSRLQSVTRISLSSFMTPLQWSTYVATVRRTGGSVVIGLVFVSSMMVEKVSCS